LIALHDELWSDGWVVVADDHKNVPFQVACNQ
jgi:hypothetical protein